MRLTNPLKSIKSLAIFIAFSLSLCTTTINAKSDFERLGDVLTLAPVGVLIVSVGIKDYEGALQLTAGSLLTRA